MNYDQMTISEMEEIYIKLGTEIEKRRNAEMREDWKKLVGQIRLFITRHGEISVIDEIDVETFVDLDSGFDIPGTIYQFKD